MANKIRNIIRSLGSKKKKSAKTTITQRKKIVPPQISYQFTDDSVTVNYPVENDGRTTYQTKSASVGSVEYGKIKEAIREGRINDLPVIVSEVERKVIDYSKVLADDDLRVENGTIFVSVAEYGFIPVPPELGQRIVAYAMDDLPFNDLKNFFRNLFENPSRNSLNSLYRFLAKNHFPITPDGCFVAYKGVSANFKDLHTGKFDNSPGKPVSVRRNEVDEDITQQCSNGLHVASYNYAKRYYGGQRMIEVKVNPKDVVAVPIKETDEKMRVCEYFVLGECEGERQGQRYIEPNYDPEYDDDEEEYDDE